MPKYDSVREMRYLRYDKIYSGNIRLKKSRKAGQKQTPQRFCGDLFITGGVVTFDGIRYNKYRVFTGNFEHFCTIFGTHRPKSEQIIIS